MVCYIVIVGRIEHITPAAGQQGTRFTFQHKEPIAFAAAAKWKEIAAAVVVVATLMEEREEFGLKKMYGMVSCVC